MKKPSRGRGSTACRTLVAVLIALASPGGALLSEEGEPARSDTGDANEAGGANAEDLRWLDDPNSPYKTPRAGEGFRTTVLGEKVVVEPRDRRSVSAWSLGFAATAPGADENEILPVGSLYFWRHPDEDFLFRGVVVGVFNDIFVAASNDTVRPLEGVLTFESFTVPTATSELVDGTRVDEEELLTGYVRPGVGFGWRQQVSPGHQDNMLALDWTVEPGFIYFDDSSDTAPDFRVPPDTFELRTHLRLRWDALTRNLLELPHEGFALGSDLVTGYRFAWDDWGRPSSIQREDGEDFHFVTAYAVLATPVPFVESERQRIVASLYGGVGHDLDRFSAPRIGGGPQGEEFFAISRPMIPGATIEEFYPNHYASLVAEYRFEPIFFTYVGPRASVSFLDRQRRTSAGIVRENDVLTSVGARLTTGFIGDLRIQIDYDYNFGVIRQSEFGGHEVVFQVSRSF